MTDLFKDIIASILNDKEYCLETKEDESVYVPFLVNRALSYHADCVLFASEMNQLNHLDSKIQYDYLFHSIRKKKRPFIKWYKKEEIENLNIVKEYYKMSDKYCVEALKLLTKEQINELKYRLKKGGIDE